MVQKWHLGEVGGGTGEGFRYTGGGPSTVRQVHCKGIRMASYGRLRIYHLKGKGQSSRIYDAFILTS